MNVTTGISSLTIFLVILCCSWSPSGVEASEKEHELIQDLLRGYNTLVRPVNNISEAIVVSLSVILQALIDVVGERQMVYKLNFQIYFFHKHQQRCVSNCRTKRMSR